MTAKRSSLFGNTAAKAEPDNVTVMKPSAALDVQQPAPQAEVASPKYAKAKTREGKRVATAYLEREAFRQLQKIAFDEETTMQALLTEGINAVFSTRGLSRIA